MTMRTKNYAWLDCFWTDVISDREGDRWVVATLFDGDLFLRDAFAHALVRDRLHGRSDVSYSFVRAWTASPDQEDLRGANILFLGRPRLFAASRLSLFAKRLEGRARGRFDDSSNGRTGDALIYGEQQLRRRELDGPPKRYHRCDLDYGVLLCRRETVGGQERRLVSIGGLGTLGTLGLTLLLTDDARRRAFADQVRALAPWHAGMHPERGVEISVRIALAGEEHLANFLNAPDFDFRVDAVAIEGDDVRVRAVVGADLVLVPAAGGRSGGEVRLRGGGAVRLSPQRFVLLRRLVEEPAGVTPGDLCRILGFKAEPREGKSRDELERRHLAKLVHDTNQSLARIEGLRSTRLIVCRNKERRYVLAGAAGSVAASATHAPAASPSAVRHPRRVLPGRSQGAQVRLVRRERQRGSGFRL